MKVFYVAMIPIVFYIGVMNAEAQETWTFNAFMGSVYNLPTPLTIGQSGYDHVNLNARYETEPFESPVYYALRIGRWKKDGAWELELIHHKLFLKNRPSEVQHFEITHGYNLLTLNRAWKHTALIFRFGAGIVITHPETTIREKTLPQDEGILSEGYYISGPLVQGAVEKRFYFWRKLFASIEGKLTVSYTRIPIQGGNADVTNVAAHGLFGLGSDF